MGVQHCLGRQPVPHRLHRRQHPEMPSGCMLLRLMSMASSCLGQKRWRNPVSSCWLCKNILGPLRHHLLPYTAPQKALVKLPNKQTAEHDTAYRYKSRSRHQGHDMIIRY